MSDVVSGNILNQSVKKILNLFGRIFHFISFDRPDPCTGTRKWREREKKRGERVDEEGEKDGGEKKRTKERKKKKKKGSISKRRMLIWIKQKEDALSNLLSTMNQAIT